MGVVSAIDVLLEQARQEISPRLAPADLAAVVESGELVVDTRPVEQRAAHGALPDALVVDRNLLEWRLDPSCPHRLECVQAGQRVVVVCNEGYSSSLAAATLRRLGIDATDLAGGYQAWLSWRRAQPSPEISISLPGLRNLRANSGPRSSEPSNPSTARPSTPSWPTSSRKPRLKDGKWTSAPRAITRVSRASCR